MWRVAALGVLLSLSGVHGLLQDGGKNRPITKVVTLMKDMLTQLQKESEEDKEAYDLLACWCETNDKGKTKAIADGQLKIATLTADIEKYASTSAGLNNEITTLQAEIAKNTGALDSATALRQKQLAEFTSDEKEMMASIGSLGSAVGALSKHNSGALLQMTDTEEIDLKTTIGSLMRKYRDLLAEVISPKQKRMMQAFVQQGDGFFDAAPTMSLSQQKGPASYSPQSGQIFGVLGQMKETFEANLAKAQEEEALNQQAYEDLKEAKESEIKTGTDQFNTKSAVLAETDEKHAQATEDLEETETVLAADTKFLANLKEHCVNIDKEFDERTATRSQEMTAVSKAMSFLTSEEASDLFSKSLGLTQEPKFLQVSADRRAQVAGLLRKAAREAHDPRLGFLAARMRLDAFGKVKESLQSMIDNLLKEKEDEIKHKDFCIDSMNTNKRTTEIKEREKADAIAKLNDHMEAMEMLTKAILVDKQDILEIRTQLKKLSEDREKANKEFQETVADQRATQKLLSATIGVLKGFYEKSALVQQKSSASQPAGPPPPPGFKKYENNAASGGVMNMIQSIINDAKAMEEEALQSEAQAQQAYEDAVADSNASVKAKQDDIIQKTELHAREEQGKVLQETTRDEKMADIEQLKKEDLDLHYDCDYALKNFDLRMTARDAEIEALKQGLATFSGATFSSLLEQGM